MVFTQEFRENAVFVIGREIDVLNLDAQHIGHGGGIDKVNVGRAVFAVIVIFPIFHEDANDVIALLLEQIGGDSGVDAAGQADDHTRELGHAVIIP